MIYLDNIDKSNIAKFVESIFAQCHSKHHQNASYHENKDHNIFQVLDENNELKEVKEDY